MLQGLEDWKPTHRADQTFLTGLWGDVRPVTKHVRLLLQRCACSLLLLQLLSALRSMPWWIEARFRSDGGPWQVMLTVNLCRQQRLLLQECSRSPLLLQLLSSLCSSLTLVATFIASERLLMGPSHWI